MLEADHLVKRFFGVTVVDDVSFVVRPGEVVGYLGPNGSGKTTTAKMCTGLIETSAGSVRFKGGNIADDLIAFRRRLGYVPEEPHLYSFQSGREYLELMGRLRDLPDRSLGRKIDALLELFGLSTAADQGIASYSKGMKQKVLLIAALLHDPDVLIFDEPDSGLDVTTTLILRHLVRTLAQRGKAILYSSHVLELVEKLCDRVIVLHRGRVVADFPAVETCSSAHRPERARSRSDRPRIELAVRCGRASNLRPRLPARTPTVRRRAVHASRVAAARKEYSIGPEDERRYVARRLRSGVARGACAPTAGRVDRVDRR
jgi:ABC-2 type transport system ATP-binding protein